MKERVSLGVLCIKKCDDGHRVLMIRKKNTYAYMAFAMGKYTNENEAIMKLLNNMTVAEKIIVLSLNFRTIWAFLWANGPLVERSYYTSKHKFDSIFLMDNGARLRKLINASANVLQLWEPPKGRKRSKNESNIQCAIREFTEETGLSSSNYRIVPNRTVKYSYVSDNNVKYTNIYFVAAAVADAACGISFKNYEQICEADHIDWLGIEQIKNVDTHGRNLQAAKAAIKIVRTSPYCAI